MEFPDIGGSIKDLYLAILRTSRNRATSFLKALNPNPKTLNLKTRTFTPEP